MILELSKETARDIYRARKAQVAIARATWPSDAPESWPKDENGAIIEPPSDFGSDASIATLHVNGQVNETLIVRCDILAKWTGLIPSEAFDVELGKDGELSIRYGQSSIKLLRPTVQPIGLMEFASERVERERWGFNQRGFESATVTRHAITPAFDVEALCAKAKELSANQKAVKAERKRIKAERYQTALQKRYDEALAVLTPAAIKSAAKRARSLRKLRQWARRISPALVKFPGATELNSPDFNPIPQESVNAYLDARLRWKEAKSKLDNYKPRSWRESGRAPREKAEAQTRRTVESVLMAGISEHVRQFGFVCHYYTGKLEIDWSYDDPTIQAKQIVREGNPSRKETLA